MVYSVLRVTQTCFSWVHLLGISFAGHLSSEVIASRRRFKGRILGKGLPQRQVPSKNSTPAKISSGCRSHLPRLLSRRPAAGCGSGAMAGGGEQAEGRGSGDAYQGGGGIPRVPEQSSLRHGLESSQSEGRRPRRNQPYLSFDCGF